MQNFFDLRGRWHDFRFLPRAVVKVHVLPTRGVRIGLFVCFIIKMLPFIATGKVNFLLIGKIQFKDIGDSDVACSAAIVCVEIHVIFNSYGKDIFLLEPTELFSLQCTLNITLCRVHDGVLAEKKMAVQPNIGEIPN